jgi:hypothetical protein
VPCLPMRIVFASVELPTTFAPISMLLPPVLRLSPASKPTATLFEPVVPLASAPDSAP